MSKKSYPEPVEALLLILGAFALLMVSAAIYSLVFGISEQTQDITESSRFFFIFGGSLFLIVPLVYARLKNYSIPNLFRLRSAPLPVLIYSVFIGISLTVLGDELDRLINMIIPMPEWIEKLMEPVQVEGGLDWAIIILGAVIIAAVAEEGLFRGFLQVTLEKKGDVTRAVLLSSISWTIIHGNPFWAIQIFVIGIFIGFLAWRSNSILPPIIVHAVYNLIAVLFTNMGDDVQLDWYSWGDHVSPLVLALAAALLVWSIQQVSLVYRQE